MRIFYHNREIKISFKYTTDALTCIDFRQNADRRSTTVVLKNVFTLHSLQAGNILFQNKYNKYWILLKKKNEDQEIRREQENEDRETQSKTEKD